MSLIKFYRNCTALFGQMSLLNHDCQPNTRTVIYENNSDLSLSLGLFASVDIWKNQCITQQYHPVVKGTMVRRKALKEWFFDCVCKRCSDPTEFGTYFSCLNCWKCEAGFLCPVNPLDECSAWVCNQPDCGHSLTPAEVHTIITETEQEIAKNENSVPQLETVLDELISKKQIHCHHYLAISVQYDITQKIVKALNNECEVNLVRRGSRYCRNILKVVNVLCPGFSYYRGVILYFLANCFFALHELDELHESTDCDMKELKEIIMEAIEIMEVEPEDSTYHAMADELETYLKALCNSK